MNTNGNNIRILVGYGSCGIAAGAKDVYEEIKKSIPAKRKDIVLEITGCNGSCHYEPIVEVFLPDQPKVSYGLVDPKRAKKIVEDHVFNLKPIDEWTFEKGEFAEGTKAFAGPQTKIVLRNCGLIDPENIEEYIAGDGYQALKKCLTSMSPDEIIKQMIASGLRGRGGAHHLQCG